VKLCYLPFVLYIAVSGATFAAPLPEDVDPELKEHMLAAAERLTGRVRGGPFTAYMVPGEYLCAKFERPVGCSVWGAYFPGSGIRLNADKINLASPLGRSVLLHEIVHYLQDQDPQEMDCYLAEKEAYTAQVKWLESFGFKGLFGFVLPDDFTLKVRCAGSGQ